MSRRPSRARIFGAPVAALLLMTLVTAALCATAPPARAADAYAPDPPSTVADFRARVHEAAALVRTSYAGAVRSQTAGQDLAYRIDELLPPLEVVRAGTQDVTLDNSVLRSLLDHLRNSTTPDGRTAALQQLTDHLASLELAVGTGPAKTLPQDRAALDKLVAGQTANEDPALSRRVAEFFDAILTAIGKMWATVTANPGGQLIAEALRWLVIIALLAVLGLAGWWIFRRVTATLASADAAAPGAGPDDAALSDEPLPHDALAYADGLAGSGRFRDAVRALMRGSVRSLRHAGLLKRTRARTTGELLRQLAGAPDDVVAPMRSLSSEFDRAWYGRRDPGSAGFAGAREGYVALVGAVERADAQDSRAASEASETGHARENDAR